MITWLCRGTLHMVRREDYPWLLGLSAPTQRQGNLRRLHQCGYSPDRARKAAALIVRMLADEGPLRRSADRAAAGVRGVRARGPGARAPAVPAVARRTHHPRAVPRRRAGVRVDARLAGPGACGLSAARSARRTGRARAPVPGRARPRLGGRPGAVGGVAAARRGGGAGGGGGSLYATWAAAWSNLVSRRRRGARRCPRACCRRSTPTCWAGRTAPTRCRAERVAEVRLGGIIRPVALVDGLRGRDVGDAAKRPAAGGRSGAAGGAWGRRLGWRWRRRRPMWSGSSLGGRRSCRSRAAFEGADDYVGKPFHYTEASTVRTRPRAGRVVRGL